MNIGLIGYKNVPLQKKIMEIRSLYSHFSDLKDEHRYHQPL